VIYWVTLKRRFRRAEAELAQLRGAEEPRANGKT
jgi:hypothetical protein